MPAVAPLAYSAAPAGRSSQGYILLQREEAERAAPRDAAPSSTPGGERQIGAYLSISGAAMTRSRASPSRISTARIAACAAS